MLSDEKRPDFEDLEQQIKKLRDNDMLDIDGDGQIDVIHIQTIMSLLGEPKCPPERIEEIKALLLEGNSEGDTRVPLDIFLTTIRNKLLSYGSEKEVIAELVSSWKHSRSSTKMVQA
jgi:Ca2+-binding EF-hand superfamily protein